jgi:hypothetical protein
MHLKKNLLAVLLASLFLSSPALADKAILVFDASGSMWAQIEGKSRIQIAQEVVGGLLKDWPSNTELGLIAYGHREKANCSDIEMLVPAGPGNSSKIKAAVDDLNPKGKTPITDAIRLAAKELRSTEEKATVILVSDGLETCNADPCAAAAELERAGVDFTVHVVGFATSEEENRQLQCLAKNTGGRFLGAGNASQLKEAMTATIKLVAKPEVAEPLTRMAVCPNTYQAFPMNAPPLTCQCSAEAATADGRLYGTGSYTSDSSICKAAVHAGFISVSGGEVIVAPAGEQTVFPGTTQNDVTSSDWSGKYKAFRFAGSAAATPKIAKAEPEQLKLQVCPNTYQAFPMNAPPLTCQCSAEAAAVDGRLYGTGAYTSDSSICKAAVHAGVIPASGGEVVIAPAGEQTVFPGTTQNDMTSSDWSGKYKAFRFAGSAAATPKIAKAVPEQLKLQVCPNTYQAFPMNAAPLTCQCSGEAATADGRLYGTGIYTSDSSICKAAVHAGGIPASGGEVVVTPAGETSIFPGTTQNGVTSADWSGKYKGFRIVRKER